MPFERDGTMNPFFSIIIPIYNIAPYLRECLDSVASQTFVDWEAICVDDGSTDDSAMILYEVAAQDSRFKVVRQPNSGVAAARNAALDLVSGEWVLFLDGDDLYAPEALNVLSTQILCNPCDIVFFRTQRFNDYMGVSGPQSLNQASVRELDNSVPILLSSSFSGGQAYRWALVKSLRQENFHYGEDMLYLTQALVRASKILALDNYLYGYRMRTNSAMHSGVSLRYFEDLIKTRVEALIAVSEVGKCLDVYSAKWIGGEITEEADRILGHLNRAERFKAMSIYREQLSVICRLDVGLQCFDVIRMRIICTCPIMRYVLCGCLRRMRKLYGKMRHRL